LSVAIRRWGPLIGHSGRWHVADSDDQNCHGERPLSEKTSARSRSILLKNSVFELRFCGCCKAILNFDWYCARFFRVWPL
jgi:hypothetical protein